MKLPHGKLRFEKSISYSGKLLNEARIPLLKEKDYFIKIIPLDGDAPKEFIKAYFYEEGSTVRRIKSSSWIPFIAKTAQKWYPHESVVEYMINRIGQVLGLHMNEIKLVRASRQVRFLSRYFLSEDETLIHGAEICGQYLSDDEMAKAIAEDRRTARELFTFEFIQNAIRMVFPNCFEEILHNLVKMIVFDGLVGNNDRHFYNWGVIDTKKKTSKLPRFAPLYDSARGLLWNVSDQDIIADYASYRHYLKDTTGKHGNKIVNYVRDAAPRISIEGNQKATHIELIDFLKRWNSEFRQVADELSRVENEHKVLDMLQSEFYPFFIPERKALIDVIIKRRFDIVRNL